MVNSPHLSLTSVNSSPDLREETLTIQLMSKLKVWEEEEWFALGIDPLETDLQNMDINYAQETWASKTVAEV